MFNYNRYMFSKPRIRNLLVLILLVYVLKLTVYHVSKLGQNKLKDTRNRSHENFALPGLSITR